MDGCTCAHHENILSVDSTWLEFEDGPTEVTIVGFDRLVLGTDSVVIIFTGATVGTDGFHHLDTILAEIGTGVCDDLSGTTSSGVVGCIIGVVVSAMAPACGWVGWNLCVSVIGVFVDALVGESEVVVFAFEIVWYSER